MIRLTRANGKALYINPQHLVEVGYDEDYQQTLVSTMAEGWYVTESPEEVASKVLEWKYIMQKGAYTNTQEMARLRELAGLEDTNHDT